VPTEQEAITNLTEGEDRWLQLWNLHIGALDQKASIVVTLDGIMLALTASFLGTVLSHSLPVVASTLFGVSTVFVLFSAGACTRVAWVPFFSSRMIAEAGSMAGAYPHMFQVTSSKDAISAPSHPIASRSFVGIRSHNTDPASTALDTSPRTRLWNL
jgi:hypothetical protein